MANESLSPLLKPIEILIYFLSDPVWYDILLNATNGWGWDELKRDFLAEQFMNKAVEEGLGR